MMRDPNDPPAEVSALVEAPPASPEALFPAADAVSMRAEALCAQADALQRLRRYDAALAAYDAALALKPDFAAAWNNRGIALHELGRYQAALASYQRALALQPDFALAWNNRGTTLLDLKDYAAALASQSRALQLEPNLVEALNNRGNLLRHFNRHAEALDSYDRAVAVRPDFAEAHTNRAHVLREMNQIDAARAAYQTVVDLLPERVAPYRKLAAVTRLSYDHPCYLALQRFAARYPELGLHERIELHFGLADALTQLGAADAAFAHVVQGNALQRGLLRYDEAATMARYAWVQQTFTGDHLQASAAGGDRSEAPVFIIGMPRSGSTLIEQVLASHPEVYGAGEYEAFSDALGDCVQDKSDNGNGLDPSAILAALGAPDCSAIGAGYQRRIAQLGGIGPAHRRVVDKTLPNFMQLGLIHLALPKARFIHARRNPLQTCLSCFAKQLGTASFSFELGELGRYYAAYDRLMAHWRAVLPPGVMLEVDYEAMVGDLPGQVRRLLAHCELEWNPACLAFERNPRPVATASAMQVRQALYAGAVQRPLPAPELIAPLLAALGSLGGA